jgi:hypothetical protein
VVLIRALSLALLVSGCGESLFDSRGGGKVDGGADSSIDGAVPSSCPTPCLADAAGDFDGTPAGSTGKWRYLDDTRNRMWTAMTGDASGMTGAGMNRITTCAQTGSAAACAQLPGALLVTSSGATTSADPALELTTTNNEIIQLTIRVHVPTGTPSQVVRLYRNAREDTLFTGMASSGTTLEQVVTVDALDGDRFLFSLAPMAVGAADVAVHMFGNPTGAVFPSTCQSAFSFNAAATTTTVADTCKPTNIATYEDFNTTPPANVLLGPSAFPELGMAADIVPDKYYVQSEILTKTTDTTLQFWTKIDVMPPTFSGAWVWSDQDLNAGGGLGIVIFDDGPGPTLGLSSCTDPGNPLMFATTQVSYPNPLAWHFIRVVHTGGKVNVCIDGVKKGMMDVPAGMLTSTFAPRVARNVVWTPSGAFVDGHLDDVRVFNAALPCE